MPTNKTVSQDNTLHIAAAVGDNAKIKLLLTNNASVNELHSVTRITPLAEAAANGHLATINYLLEAGADVTAGGLRMRRSVLDYAHNYPEIVAILLPKVEAAVNNWQENSEKTNADKAKIALLAFSLAKYYLVKDEKTKANSYFLKALTLTSKLQNNPAIYSALTLLTGDYYLRCDNIKLATNHILNALDTYLTAELPFAIAAFEDTIYTLLKRQNTDLSTKVLDKLFYGLTVGISLTEKVNIITEIGYKLLQEQQLPSASLVFSFYTNTLAIIKTKYYEKTISATNAIMVEFILALSKHYLIKLEFKLAAYFLETAKKQLIENTNVALKKKVEVAYLDCELREQLNEEAKHFMTKAQNTDPQTTIINRIEMAKRFNQLEGHCSIKIKNFAGTIEIFNKLLNPKKLSEKHQVWLSNAKEFYQLVTLAKDEKAIYTIVVGLQKLIDYALQEKITDITVIRTIFEFINLAIQASDYLEDKDLLYQQTGKLIKFLDTKHGQQKPYIADDKQAGYDNNVIAILQNCLVLQKKYNRFSDSDLTVIKTNLACLKARQGQYSEAFAIFQEILPNVLLTQSTPLISRVISSINSLQENNLELSDDKVEMLLKGSLDFLHQLASHRDTPNLKKLIRSFAPNSERHAKQNRQKGQHNNAISYYLIHLECHYHVKDIDNFVSTIELLANYLLELAKKKTTISTHIILNTLTTCINFLRGLKLTDKLADFLNTVELSDNVIDLTDKTTFYELMLNQYKDLTHKISKEKIAYFSYQLALCLSKQENKHEDSEKTLELLKVAKKYQKKFPDYTPLTNINTILTSIQLDLAECHITHGDSNKALDLYYEISNNLSDSNENSDSQLKNEVLLKSNNLILSLANEAINSNNFNKAIVLYSSAITNYKILNDQKNLIITIKQKMELILLFTAPYLRANKFAKANMMYQQALDELATLIQSNPQLESELAPLANKFKTVIEDTQRQQNEYFKDTKPSYQNFFLQGKTLPTKKIDKALKSDDEVNNASITPPKTSSDKFAEALPATIFQGGKVGNSVTANFIQGGESETLYTVFDKNSASIQKLKGKNLFLYRELKKAVLEGGICNKFGESGIKHIKHSQWTWEAKVTFSAARIFGETQKDPESNKSYIVFSEYSPKGLHK